MRRLFKNIYPNIRRNWKATSSRPLKAHLRTLNPALYCRLSCSMARCHPFFVPPSPIDICVHIEFNNYKMFNRQICLRIMTKTVCIILKCRVYFFYISTLHIWTFPFLNNSFIRFYYFTSFGFLNFWILVTKGGDGSIPW